jgi:hypothetical protein
MGLPQSAPTDRLPSVIIRNGGAVFRQPENDAVEGIAEYGFIRNVQTCLCSKLIGRW